MDKRHVIDATGKIGHEAAHPFSALAMLLPIPRALHAVLGRALEQLHRAARVELLSVAANQFRLVIKSVSLAGRAGHEELHDPFGASAMVQAAIELRSRLRLIGQQLLLAQQTA